MGFDECGNSRLLKQHHTLKTNMNVNFRNLTFVSLCCSPVAWFSAIFIRQNQTPAAGSLRAAVATELQQVLKLNYQGKLNF
jgi:hypothetical protein